MIDVTHSLLLVGVITLVTVALRFLPFWVFRRRVPAAIAYLGRVLPYAIMGMLVVYCLKDVSFVQGTHGVPEAAVTAVVLLHRWRHNTLLSILCGTVLYMILIRLL